MTSRSKTTVWALLVAVILAGPAYWAGQRATIYLLRQETVDYQVWQKSYFLDRQFYEAISKSPPPRYNLPQPWERRVGGGACALLIAALAFGGICWARRSPDKEIPAPVSSPPAHS